MQIQKRGELIKLVDAFNLPRVGVEVGVAEGRFSKELFNSGFERLFLVDIWEEVPFIDGCASFEQSWHNENYKKVQEILKDEIEQDKAIILKGFSHKVAKFVDDESVALVYIDGDHSYKGVKSDIAAWWPKLMKGGLMAFHDFANYDYGVNRAVVEFIEGEQFVNIINEDGSSDNIGAWIRK